MTTYAVRIYVLFLMGIACVNLPGEIRETQDNSTYVAKGFSKGRIQFAPSQTKLMLEQPNEISIHLRDKEVRSAEAELIYDKSEGDVPDTGYSEIPIRYHADGSAYLLFTPEGLGKLTIKLTIYFDDGYAEIADLDTEVVPSETKPEEIVPESGQGNGTIYMDLSEQMNQVGLYLKAHYKGAAHAVPVPNKFATFKILAENDRNPPIAIDTSSGMITALHVGHAIVESTFQGAVALTCVAVEEDWRSGEDRTTCSELVPRGMQPLKSGFENSLPNHTATKRTNSH